METPRSLMHELFTFRSNDARRMWREGIKARDDNRCTYCGSTENLTIDHVRPRSKGGETTATNCVTACLECNQAKGSLEVNEFLTLHYNDCRSVYGSSAT
ncbi:HNH endonuclease [Cyanophage SS120-1]|uniref:HNH endonuclease n=1 Tax=Cyanophage SS120-1 TaxID=616674 RepID=M1U3A7_9CAUD|nr:HNH endonuclease [Cyanophage SS120-1]AGG54518.1 HNH endonuclease [Cyanophage SS120-1]